IKEPAVGFNNSPPAGSIGTLTPNSRRRQGYVNAENTTGLRNRRSVWNVATQGNVAKAHFATFPEKLIEPCVLAGSRPGGIVLDPFVGSGTTAVVAAKHGREYIGIDLNAEYAEMARIRAAAAEGSTTNDNI
ncbi:MAG: site-specific DNA-methyltransferase, partial [Clostridiales bacterium]|nr:site-specific DNA-methyltransferase [Clostridiales bacterium]